MLNIFRAAPVIAIALAVCGGVWAQNLSDEDAGKLAGVMLKVHESWGPGLNSPGASLSLMEFSRSGRVIKYRLYAKGLPREQTYTLVQWPVTQRNPGAALHGITLDASGLAVCAGKPNTCGSPDNPNDPIDLVFSPVQGEPIRLALVSSQDSQRKAAIKSVPDPYQAVDNGCSLQAVLLMPHGELVALEGRGFPANAELPLESWSGKERNPMTVKTDLNGAYESALLPFVKGEKHGTTHVKAKSAACSPELTFEWGARD